MSIAFAGFDIRNAFTPSGRVLAPLAFAVVVAAALPVPAIAVAAAVAVASLSASSPFLGDERGRLDVLYSTLPVSRSSVVVGRYLTLVAVYLVAAAVASAASIVSAVVRGRPVDLTAFGQAHIVGFLLIAVALSVQVPVFFAVGFTRARPMMYLPLVVLAVGAWGAGQLGIIDSTGPVLSPVSGGLLDAAAVLAGVVVLAASGIVSNRAYRRRQI